MINTPVLSYTAAVSKKLGGLLLENIVLKEMYLTAQVFAFIQLKE